MFLSLQCKPEYKVPGLYVIDSIVRQSRHQFGTEKDVFAPRFSKNIIPTFQHLYRCPSDDKVWPFAFRSLVFTLDAVQSYFDFDFPVTCFSRVRSCGSWTCGKRMLFSKVTSSSRCWTWLQGFLLQALLPSCRAVLPPWTTPHLVSQRTQAWCESLFCLYLTCLSVFWYQGTPATPATPANIVQGLPDWASQITNTDTVAAVAQILQSPQGQQVRDNTALCCNRVKGLF